MTRRLDLGTILAIAGAAIAGIAIIAGFIVVGGPGHARDQRLDDLTSQKIGQLVGVVQCAFDASGIASVDYSAAAGTRALPMLGMPPALCDGGISIPMTIGTGDTPAAPGDITYQETTPSQVRICANFRTATTPAMAAQTFSAYGDIYPALARGHPAGVDCLVLDLVKSGAPFGNALPQPEAPPK